VKEDSVFYENLKINYIPGHAPDLVLFDADDKEIERTGLSKMKNAEIHALVQSKGFVRRETPVEPKKA